ncbi:D-alanine--D-alanine ligase [Patescibacteria group bacterium]|nr:D-alanine--D-alanine ligase [Patescibacteria group bacterium]MBU1500880.1 D-alanine--D-alanine ligase [Patescibacteria group bacterium]MBU2080935.1 D-alanine--D-alanine ligase [Patescibacteria group bacterium]MBU2124040.1 D-alanine--D-alanine ligase [Patescibacteria group bacterium]MBU2194669.1 D-alanine--D-alanine ligase [Patescibacteria group bacterium]
MRGTVVGVLRGGPSQEHEVSLKTGHAILSNLSEDRYSTRDIYIDKEGVWHEKGRSVAPEKVLRSLDAVLIGLHGEYGEDGEVQKLLERYGVPYAGSDSFASYLAMHKVLTKEKAKEHGIKTPKYRFIEKESDAEEMAKEITRSFHQPVVVKPVRWGSSVGVSIVGGFKPVHTAIVDLLSAGAQGVLVEEYIRGTEATVGVVEDLRGEKLYGLPAIEIVPPNSDFFSYDAKYSGRTREIVPGRFSKPVQEELVSLARTMHEALGLRHYSRSDFMVSPKGVYFIETNTLPGMTEESLLPKSLQAIGVSFPDFLSHLVELALRGKRR